MFVGGGTDIVCTIMETSAQNRDRAEKARTVSCLVTRTSRPKKPSTVTIDLDNGRPHIGHAPRPTSRHRPKQAVGVSCDALWWPERSGVGSGAGGRFTVGGNRLHRKAHKKRRIHAPHPTSRFLPVGRRGPAVHSKLRWRKRLARQPSFPSNYLTPSPLAGVDAVSGFLRFAVVAARFALASSCKCLTLPS